MRNAKSFKASKKIKKEIMDVKIGYYRPEDWYKFKNMVDDLDNIHDYWEEWHAAFLKMKKDLIKKGYNVLDVVVDLDQLNDYCIKNNLKNVGATRSQFIQIR